MRSGVFLHQLCEPTWRSPAHRSRAARLAALAGVVVALPFRAVLVLALDREPNRDRDRGCYRSQHPRRIHRADLARPRSVHGRRRVRERAFGDRRGVFRFGSASRSRASCAAVVGVFFGLPSLRLKGLYLAIATLAAQQIVEWTLTHWTALTGGTEALVVPAPTLFGARVNYRLRVLLDRGRRWRRTTALFTANLFRSRTGRAFLAIRDQDVAAAAIGGQTCSATSSPRSRCRRSSSAWRARSSRTIAPS